MDNTKVVLHVDDQDLGADGYLLKPILPEQLVSTVDGLIDRRASPDADGGRPCITTDAAGRIIDLTADAAKLLNISARGARGRNLPSFFTDNRPRLIADLARAADGLIIEQMNTLSPRDRRPVRVHIDLSVLPARPGEQVQLRWLVSPHSR
jgi:hypothetical protein